MSVYTQYVPFHEFEDNTKKFMFLFLLSFILLGLGNFNKTLDIPYLYLFNLSLCEIDFS